MLKVRLTHSTGLVEIREWNAAKTSPRDAQLCYDELGITVEILSYTPTA